MLNEWNYPFVFLSLGSSYIWVSNLNKVMFNKQMPPLLMILFIYTSKLVDVVSMAVGFSVSFHFCVQLHSRKPIHKHIYITLN